jgi:sugar PTS system EIIA component
MTLPVDGEVKALSEVNDYLFNKKIMGEGAAIIPSGNFVYSPVDGVIALIYESKHALIIKSDDGLDILIHIGLDSAKFEGRGFSSYNKAGDKVKTGDKVMFFDRDFIEKNATIITPIVITNSQIIDYVDINFKAKKAGDKFMEIHLK